MCNEPLIDADDSVEKGSDEHSCTYQSKRKQISRSSPPPPWPTKIHDLCLCLRIQTLCNEPFTTGRAVFLGSTAIVTYIICQQSSFKGMERLAQSNLMVTGSVEGIAREVAKLVLKGGKKGWW
ncbi:uncharacterized protein PAC_09080 [Phialocephala subalpina]|uniref:Uncharacterized protein n=1 Tax=Phialocephala subalpina TaxID=576137 RepID=A0A1L7X2D7_9HELO|nr:uncharacterized protein PAC_09080 [Phialocephala subalpina]